MSKIQKAVENTAKTLSKVSNEQSKVTKETKKTADATEDVSKQAEELARQQGLIPPILREQMREAEGVTEEASETADEVQRAKIGYEQMSGAIEGCNGLVNSMLGTVTKITMALGATTLGFVKKGLDVNTEIDSTTRALSTLMGSAEKASAEIENLKVLAKTTPFSFTGLAKGEQLLISAGLSAEGAEASMMALGNAIVATGGGDEEFQRMVVNLQQVKNAGVATALDIKQFAYAGIDIYGMLADYLGVSKEEASGMKVTWDMLNGALQKSAKEGGKYFGALQNQSDSGKIAVSNFGDAVDLKLAQVTESFYDLYRNGLMKLTEWIDGLDPNDIIRAVELVAGALGGIIGSLLTLKGLLFAFKLSQMVGPTTNLATALFNMATGASVTTEVLGGFFSALGGFVGPIIAVVGVLVAVGVAIKQLWQESALFRYSILMIISNIKSVLINLYNAVIKPFFDNLMKAIEFVKPYIELFWDSFKNGINKAVDGISMIIDAFTPLINFLISVFGPIIQFIASFIVDVLAVAFVALLTVGSIVFEGIGSFIQWVGEVAKTVSDAIVEFFNGGYTKIGDIWSGLVGFFGEVLNGIWSAVSTTFQNIGDKISAVIKRIQSTWKDLKGFAVNVASGISSAFQNVANKLKSIMNSVIGGINGAIDVINLIPGVSVGHVPYLERGGILKKGQIGFLEGNGAEAVVPLDRNKAWISAVAKDFAQIMPTVTNNNDNGQVFNFYQEIKTPDKIARAIRIQQRYGLQGGY